ncbi:HAMP domain-containing protein [Mucilaginibacter limnophilus]|uniref:histidine kinase n=1 Tax=Mucilaginibacter limnophilus TaxID=1932778 RepID=A0A437MVR6_9SPHI|nr:ATP-binding protein [Mucilaginibacter limnophilus]RVU01717.1 HAMP domain-containing protein [Mucilaginibacter limnophilus]
MSYRVKIRWLLALLTVSLFVTALIVPRSYTPEKTLEQTAKALEGKIHAREQTIDDLVNDSVRFNQLKTLEKNNKLALDLIDEFTIKNRVWVLTLKNNKLAFWSGIRVLPDNPAVIKEGYSFTKHPNGYYETIRRTKGNFSAIFFFPVVYDFALQNKYLRNGIDQDLFDNNTIELADITDAKFRAIHSINGSYLFSVKLKPNIVNSKFYYSEFILWLLAFTTLCVLVHELCNSLANRGRIVLAVLALTAFIVVVRFVNLYYNLPDFSDRLDAFNPKFYASSVVYRSLGDLSINLLSICWLTGFLYLHRHKLLTNVKSKAGNYLILIVCTLLLIGGATALLSTFYGLVINSNINFDVTNVLNLSGLSITGLVMLCFAFLIFFFLNDVCVEVCMKLPIPSYQKVGWFIILIIAATVLITWQYQFTPFFLFLALLTSIRYYSYRYERSLLSPSSLLLMVLICSVISSIELNNFQSSKEADTRKLLARKLLVPDDNNANQALKRIEKQILKDPLIVDAFNNSQRPESYLKTRLKKLYFDDYLSRYELQVYRFNPDDQPMAGGDYSLDIFKDMVIYSSFKVSDYFYRENDTFGFQYYFAILPVKNKAVNSGTMVIELKSKSLHTPHSFPDLLLRTGDNDDKDKFREYSYAFYTDNRLVTKNGSYVYDLVNSEFTPPLKQFKFISTKSNRVEWYRKFNTYSHLIYKPSARNLIVITKEENMLFFGITSLTFFFVLILLFALLIILVRWLWLRIRILTVSENRIKWSFSINFDKILYKTRIQFSIILTVVVTLVMVGFITFLFISTQYNNQQEEMIRNKISRITQAFEEGLFNKYINNIQQEDFNDFEEVAKTYSADLSMFDPQGKLLATTQPKIYEYGLQKPLMNSKAYIYMAKLKKSEFVNSESLGSLKYKSVYAPLKDKNDHILAYLQLPYYSNEADYKERIGSLLNAMINVYAMIFITIGLLAVIIARQITAPLNFIQTSLGRIIYGRKNEPIKWERDDEIGALVKEYNKMISALENSAQKLAQSERESAWREMAKQVAHEIKNPLTPLKLGLQLLEKSWRDKDPKFDQKFERFSRSFVEQIESLSSIASEFSAFAKMPDTRMEQLNIFDMLNQAVTIFKQMDNLTISFPQPEKPFYIIADRDQLLRCFNNLLKNAIEATPPDRKGVISINYTITSKNILLSFKDNGNGIPEEMRERIFEPNFTTKSSGTGLGLAFIKNSIENAGGKVWFETSIGVGTTFYFSLPSA